MSTTRTRPYRLFLKMQGVSFIVTLRTVADAAGFLYDKALMLGDTIK
jgi:hypothetical protein